jgi:DNA polymerase
VATTSAADYIPDTRELSELAEGAMDCHGCGLYRDANQNGFRRWRIVGVDGARR